MIIRPNAELFKNHVRISRIVLCKNDKLIEDYKNKIETNINRNIQLIENAGKYNLLNRRTIFKFDMIL